MLFLKNKWQAIINYGVKNNFFYQFQKYRYLTTSLFYTFARNIKKHIKSLATREVSQPREKIENYAKVIKKHSKLSLSQQEAVMLPLQNRFSMINGVAGSGKTFVIASIVKFVFALKMFNNCFVLAPTGKAVQVLRSKCRAALAEKHLWFDDDNVITVDAFIYRQIAHKKIKPRQQILVLIDEAGMLSTGLFSDLLTILEQADFDYHLVLVGDHQQLFPIFPGKLFFDLLAKQKLVKITLPTTFRHQQSGILRLANKVLAGKMLKLAVLQNQQDVVFINTNRMSDQQVNQRIKELSRSFLDQNNRLSFYYDFQIIAPFRYQCHMINQNLNAYLFPASDLHKKLMVNKNDYVRKVFNGNVGEVVAFTKRLVTMKFLPSPKKNTKIKVPRYYLADACAVTIHKAQGSEYDTVVVVMNKSTRMPNFLTRNLFYTALTRAKSKLYIFGSYALLCSVTKTITINKQTLLGNSYF